MREMSREQENSPSSTASAIEMRVARALVGKRRAFFKEANHVVRAVGIGLLADALRVFELEDSLVRRAQKRLNAGLSARRRA